MDFEEFPFTHHIDASGDCWEWTSYKELGYGRVNYKSKTDWAHRAVWKQLVGPIPEGMELDHLCQNRACVNPDHLEPVTPHENRRRVRSNSPNRCRRGHLSMIFLDKRDHRRCRGCLREDLRSSRAAAKQAL